MFMKVAPIPAVTASCPHRLHQPAMPHAYTRVDPNAANGSSQTLAASSAVYGRAAEHVNIMDWSADDQHGPAGPVGNRLCTPHHAHISVPVTQEAIGPCSSASYQHQHRPSSSAQHVNEACRAADGGRVHGPGRSTHESQKKGPPAEGRPELISAMLRPMSRAISAAAVQPQTTCRR